MFSRLINKKQRYNVVSSVPTFPVIDDKICVSSMKKLENNIYRIAIGKTSYIMKYIDNSIEWNFVKYIIAKKDICPYLITYYACVTDNNNKKYIIMELGKMDLYHHYDIHPLHCNNIYEIINVCFKYLIWSHDHMCLVHTDIKPGNLMLCNDGTTKIIDIESLECSDDIYTPDDELDGRSDDNQLYPRRECTYLQFSLFSVVILILDLLSVCDSLLVARKDDNKLCDIIDGLRFFEEEMELAVLFKRIIMFEFTDFAEPYELFLRIIADKQNNKFILK